jgi:transcriptional regulator with PAS, ATPase and Fis domain
MGSFSTGVPSSREPRSRRVVVASTAMRDLLESAERAANCDAKVLITGESGVGKDTIAQHIHENSRRKTAEYIAINCAGLTESLLESELFGHVKGSFTGAYRDNPGKLQMAHGGTLFLDEIGEMSLRMQALLLRFLENGEVQTVGSQGVPRTVDVRVIAATNRNLTELTGTGKFREDLLYRLRVIHLHVPPLRARRDDIQPLAKHFLGRGERPVSLTPDAWSALERYGWPGNVRELQNVMEQLIWLTERDRPVDVGQLPEIVRSGPSLLAAATERRRQLADDLYQAIVTGGYSFWEHIHPLFLNRDITRHDMRELLRRGLIASRGNHRSLLQLFRIPTSDYKRFMNFVATHDCGLDYREFRNASVESRLPRVAPPKLSLLKKVEAAPER